MFLVEMKYWSAHIVCCPALTPLVNESSNISDNRLQKVWILSSLQSAAHISSIRSDTIVSLRSIVFGKCLMIRSSASICVIVFGFRCTK